MIPERKLGHCSNCGREDPKSQTETWCTVMRGLCSIWTHEKVKNAIRLQKIINFQKAGMTWNEIKKKLMETNEY